MKPLITVVAIAYNQENWVAETLNSIKNQTYPNIQLIIADDGSTDNTKHIIAKWIPEHFPDAVFLNHQQNRGITSNYNTTLPYIKGDFVKLIGCDDVMLENTIEVLHNELSGLPQDYGVVYTDMICIDEHGELVSNMGLVERRGHPTPSGQVYLPMITKPFVTAASILFKREVLNKVGRFNELVFYEDFDFYLRASRFFKFQYLPEKTVKYRIHQGSQINSSSRIRYFINTYFVYLSNYDKTPPFRKLFEQRLLFCIKNLYTLKFKKSSVFSFKVFLKTGNIRFLKFVILSLPLIPIGNEN